MIVDILLLICVLLTSLAWGGNELWVVGLLIITVFGILGAGIIFRIAQGALKIGTDNSYIPIIAFSIYVTICSYIFSVEIHSSIVGLLLMLVYLSIVFVGHCGFELRGGTKILFIGIIILGAFQATYGLIQYLGGYNYIWGFPKIAYRDLATGTLINRNHFALLINICISSGVGYLYYRSLRLLRTEELSFRRIIAAPGSALLGWIVFWIVFMGLALIFSMSRMGIGTMFCSIAIMFVMANLKRPRKRTATIGLAMVIAIIGLAVYVGIDEVLVRYEDLSKERETDRGRIAIWRDAWKMVEQNPLFGQGLGTFQWTYPAYETVDPDRPARYAHNDYLQILIETGIIGLGLLLWFFVSVWRVAVKNLRDSTDPLVKGIGLATIGALTAIALQEITDFGLYIPGVAVVASLIVGLNLRARAMALEN